VFALAVISLLMVGVVSWRQNDLTSCLRDRDTADQSRTRAIAQATDAERKAEAEWVAATGTLGAPAIRSRVLTAYAHTDAVRKANPAPPVVPC
jgi:hypothetical protein